MVILTDYQDQRRQLMTQQSTKITETRHLYMMHDK